MRTLFALVTACFALSVLAEDLIVFRNGDVVKAVVLEIQKTDVKYKRASNPQGPTYTVSKADLLSIVYENGEKDNFGETRFDADTSVEQQQLPESQNSGPQQFDPVPAADNAERISLINNSTVRHGDRKPDENKLKTTKNHTWILGVTDGSILSDENISIDFVPTWFAQFIEKGKTKTREFFTPSYNICKYKIIITNKTTHPIYIDLANSFRIWPSGESEPFYGGISITNITGNQSGGTLGLGAVTNALGVGGVVGQLAQGIGIGGGSNNSTSVTTTESNIISIPPGAKAEMPRKKNVEENTIWLDYEDFIWIQGKTYDEVIKKVAINNKDRFEKNRYVALSDGEEWKGNSYYITYSTSPDFSTYYSIPFGFYVRGVFGSKNHYDEFTADDGLVIIGGGFY